MDELITLRVKRLPERINVMRVVSYDVEKIKQDIHEATEMPLDEINTEDILAFIEDWVAEDFGCSYGHTGRIDDLIYQDENGNDL